MEYHVTDLGGKSAFPIVILDIIILYKFTDSLQNYKKWENICCNETTENAFLLQQRYSTQSGVTVYINAFHKFLEILLHFF